MLYSISSASPMKSHKGDPEVFYGRASAKTFRGPVTGPTMTNVLANLKNWKLDFEKLESHLEHLKHRLELLEHGNEKFAPQSAFHQIKHYYFLCFLSLIFYSQVD